MATSNFKSSADHIYAVMNDDEFVYEETRDNLQYEFDRTDRDKSNVFAFVKTHEYEAIGEGILIGQLYASFDYLGFEFTMVFNIIMRSGYYSGFNLDYEFSCGYDGDNCDTIEEMVDDFEDYAIEDMKGLYAIHGKRLRVKLEAFHDEIEAEVIRVFEMYSDTLIVVARFSNGETFYKKVEEESFDDIEKELKEFKEN